ncbi:hypothetical protein QW71_29900 [Paenibacillus sp. IHB B 3415]|uniref:substrate-binding domain-containing protein n=1 Tax=Paenibacillus sp. IHB B 3415 TaxID=867080 RepID=UPI0005750CD9|nr:substrate-binding domain-containing protein [Paenibacillus sp. IHB B 3415]KHL92329.1 hypothetical protein QW71_29900 [Paenibacillus sp. IHB B 3415]
MPFVLWYILFAFKPMYGLQIAFKDYSVFQGIGQAWPILRKVQELGLNIPEQLSIVAMEHGELEACPGLSRPALLVQEAGERAAELMLRRIANPLAPYEQIRLLGPFLTGETVAEPSLC